MPMTPEQQEAVEKHIADRVAKEIKDASKRKWHEMNASQIVTVMVVIFGAIVSIGWFQRDLQGLILWKGQTDVRIEELAKDRNDGSRRMALLENTKESHEQRLQKVEDVRERLGVIEEKLSNLQQMLKEDRDSEKDRNRSITPK